MSDILLNYLVIGLINILTLTFLGYLIHYNEMLEAKGKKAYFTSIIVTMIIILAEIITAALETSHIYFRSLHIGANVVGFSLSPLLPLLLAEVFAYPHENTAKKFYIFPFLNGLLTILSPWMGWIFIIDANGTYARGRLFGLYILSYLCCIVGLFISTIHTAQQYQKGYGKLFIALYLFAVLGTTVQIILPSVHASWHCLTICLVLHYILMMQLRYENDALTGILNRRAYIKVLKELESCGSGIIILLDVDDLKLINDTYGHQQGDICLNFVANNIHNCFATVGYCHRIGGDEFAVISLSNDEEAVKQAIQQLISQLKSSRKTDPTIPYISYGYCMYDKEQMDLQDAIQIADDNLYEFKRANKQHNHKVPQSTKVSLD